MQNLSARTAVKTLPRRRVLNLELCDVNDICCVALLLGGSVTRPETWYVHHDANVFLRLAFTIKYAYEPARARLGRRHGEKWRTFDVAERRRMATAIEICWRMEKCETSAKDRLGTWRQLSRFYFE